MTEERRKAELETIAAIEIIRDSKNPDLLLIAANSYAKGLRDGAAIEQRTKKSA